MFLDLFQKVIQGHINKIFLVKQILLEKSGFVNRFPDNIYIELQY